MNIPKAIEILTKYLPTHRWPPNTGLEDAMKLGIEAMKRIAALRKDPTLSVNVPLPGETKD